MRKGSKTDVCLYPPLWILQALWSLWKTCKKTTHFFFLKQCERGHSKENLMKYSSSLRGHVSKTTNDHQRLLHRQPPGLDTLMRTEVIKQSWTGKQTLPWPVCARQSTRCQAGPVAPGHGATASVYSHNTTKVAKYSWGESRTGWTEALGAGSHPTGLIRDSEGPTDSQHFLHEAMRDWSVLGRGFNLSVHSPPLNKNFIRRISSPMPVISFNNKAHFTEEVM